MRAHGFRTIFTAVAFFAAAFISIGALLTPHTAKAANILETQTCGSTRVDVYGYGAGMMHQLAPMTIGAQRVAEVNLPNDCAVIEWGTDVPSTSQIIWGEKGMVPSNVDTVNETEETAWGFPHSTTQNNSGLAHHKAVVTSLKKNTEYVYRAVNRAHPGATPQFGPEQVLVIREVSLPVTPAAPTVPAPITPPTVVTPPTYVPPVYNPPATYAPPKAVVPDTPKVTVIATAGAPKIEVETPAVVAISPEEVMGETESTQMSGGEEVIVPAAVTAASAAFGTGEEGVSTFKERMARAFAFLKPNTDRMKLSSDLGLLQKDRYIIPILFVLLLLFLAQQLLLPALGIVIQRPVVFWMLGIIALAVLAGLMGYTYATLILVALFLILLAWYLLQTASEAPETKKK